MSVTCFEDGRPIVIAEQGYCATIESAVSYLALCNEHILKIPAGNRLCSQTAGGIDIHHLFGLPNGYSRDPYSDTISFSKGLELGDYAFSIAPAIASLILPRTCQVYLK